MSNIELLYIKDFGPIKETTVCIRKITVMIGEQGAGKSCIVKLYSLFSWLEKALMRRMLTIKDVVRYARFRKIYAAYNNLDSYFKQTTMLRFEGFHYVFLYTNETLEIKEKVMENDSFSIAKVMYVPAERNVLGGVDHPARLKGLTEPMMNFLDEYDKARNVLKNGYAVPFGNVDFEYDALNDISKLRNPDYEVRLSAASSGFQSSLPLLLVSRNLSDMVRDSSMKEVLSDRERKALQKEVEAIFSNGSLSEDVKMASLNMLSSRYRYSRFVNIVEEMELNLFPDSQKNVLYELVGDACKLSDNRLVMTTHSPYVINYLTLSVKASQVAAEITRKNRPDLLERIGEVVPVKGMISEEDLIIYEMDKGVARVLDNYDGLPSDRNFLNVSLEDTNRAFDEFLEIEEELG